MVGNHGGAKKERTGMRAWIVSWALVVAVFAASGQDMLQLKNGDRFRGAFIGFDATKGFGWKHNSIFSELWVESSAVARLQLNAGEGAASRSHSARASVTLSVSIDRRKTWERAVEAAARVSAVGSRWGKEESSPRVACSRAHRESAIARDFHTRPLAAEGRPATSTDSP